MNVVILSPQYPANHYYFCANLKKLGATVLGIADENYENLHEDLKSVLTEYYKVTNMHDYDQLVRAMGYFTHKYGKIDCFDSHNEYWVETDAGIRTDFNISGVKNEAIKQIKQKSLMEKRLKRAGVTTVPSKVVRTLKEATNFIKKIGYPVVARPDVEIGATIAYKVNNQQELMDFFTNKIWAEYFIESFITGKKYSFDGLADHEGNPVFYTSNIFSEGAKKTANNDSDTYYYSLRHIPKNLEEAGMKTLKAFDIRDGFFHFEFMITPEDEVVALGVNMCPPNNLTMDMFNFANDVDLYYEWGNIVMNGSRLIDYSRKYHCAYIGRKATQDYAHSHEEIMEKYGEIIVKNELVSGSNYGYVARSQELSDILEIIDFIHAQ